MNKKFLRRIGAVAISAALSAGALMMFAGCTTQHPEVTITYTFNNKDYKVEYVLSRNDAPQTVIHFIELADAGFYDGTIIHNYTSNFLYGGGYRLVDEDGNDFDYKKNGNDNGNKAFELSEINYVEVLEDLESNHGFKFTRSVWKADEESTMAKPKKGDALYSVRAEAAGQVGNQYGREYTHSTGALVMYYTAKGSNFKREVVVERADAGKNGNQALAQQSYVYNSTTSLFYTYTSPNTNSDYAKTNCVFGMAKNYKDQLENGLLAAIRDYIDANSSNTSTDEEGEEIAYSFTETQTVKLNRYDPYEELRSGDLEEDFATPMLMPIVIKSVKVTKY